jgi:hypothetical protein
MSGKPDLAPNASESKSQLSRHLPPSSAAHRLRSSRISCSLGRPLIGVNDRLVVTLPTGDRERSHAVLAHVLQRHRLDRIVEARHQTKSPRGAAANALSPDLAKRRIVTLRIERRADHLSKDGCKLEGAMQTYDNLVELARLCLEQSRKAKNPSVSAEFMHLAKGYQMRAATMDKGKLPDIGEEEAAP